MSESAEKLKLAESYLETDRRQRVQLSKIGCVLALVLMPAGFVLDAFVYTDYIGELFASRMICDAAVLVILLLLFTKFGERNIRVLGISWALLPAAAISWMIWFREGAESPYYAGLNLVIIAVSLLMPWTLAEVLATCTITLAFYVAACLLHQVVPPDNAVVPDDFPIRQFANNVYFIALTAIITSTGSYFISRLRFRDFRLRFEIGERNQELAASYDKLAELDRLKSEFFANVSHELRTPLTLIIAPLDEVLKQGGTGKPTLDDTLTIARDNALRLLRLINDLLDMVRLEERGAELNPTPADLTTLVPGVINSAAQLAKSKGLELRVHTPEQHITAKVDSNAIEKVLLNLLTNAVKFTPAGGSIDVELTANDDHAIIEIKDTGIGISADDLPKIFERFGQLDSSSTRQYSGVGIGLALSRELVEAHGGKLTATSAPGKGTVMCIELPTSTDEIIATDVHSVDAIAEVHSAARRSLAVDANSNTDEMPAVGTGPRTVLIVEDEPDMRRFLVSLLSSEFRVVQAANGLKGYDLAVKEKPELALLDLMLPGMDGLDLCAKLRAEPGLESLKIMLLTARTDERSKITALERGANDFLTKPFSSLEVRKRVANLLRSAELEERLRATNEELKDTIRTLRRTEAQLIQSEKVNALGTLAAGLLHEINNPLNFTLTAVQLAHDDLPPDNADLKETLDDIESGMKRIRDIVSDLRSFAYPEREGNQTLFRVTEAINTAKNLTAHELKDVNLKVQVDESLHAVGSKNQVVQVLINLFANAAKATAAVKDNRAAEILVSGCDNNGRVNIRVRDNGTGIEETALKRVFDPFYTTGQPGEGMGLGLSICHTIIEAHGGELKLESREGDWTEVSFDLASADKET